MRVPRLRGRVGPAWWRLLGGAGGSKERWTKLPHWQRRGILFVVWATIGFVLILAFGGGTEPALLTFLVLAALVVPPWHEVPRVGRFIVPFGLLVVALMYPFYAAHEFTIPIFGEF